MKQAVVFDLDDVLAAFNASLCEHLAWWLKDPTVVNDHESWEQYDIKQYYPQIGDMNAVFLQMWENGSIASLTRREYFAGLANAAGDLGYEVIVLTARSWIPNAYELTSSWLADHGVRYDRLIISDYRHSKRDKFPIDVQVVAYFDDNIHNIIDCADLTQRAFIVDRAWNRKLPEGADVLAPNVIRIAEVAQVTDYKSALLDLLD
jgi:FMN phosphatase YigB (HAD superfamily)